MIKHHAASSIGSISVCSMSCTAASGSCVVADRPPVVVDFSTLSPCEQQCRAVMLAQHCLFSVGPTSDPEVGSESAI